MAISVTGLARAFRAVVLAEPGSAERAVADAMRAYPAWTSGTARPERALMLAVPGLLLKSGAEGVEGFALADGRAGAFKMRTVPLAAGFRSPWRCCAGWAPKMSPVPIADALAALATSPVYGGGQVVGEIRATTQLLGVPAAGELGDRLLVPGAGLLGDGLGGEVIELGRLTRQLGARAAGWECLASPSAMNSALFSYPAEV